MTDYQILAVGLSSLFAAAALAALTFIRVPAATTGVARSLLLIQQLGKTNLHETEPAAESFGDRIVVPAMASLARLARRMSPGGTVARLQRQLDLAGNPPAWTSERVLGAKGVGLIIGCLLAFVLLGDSSFFVTALGIAAGAGAGFFLPDLLVYNHAVKRQEKVRLSLAENLDLLTVSVEAGLGFDAALAQVARNGDGPIAAEFFRVLKEMQIGKSRVEAIGGLADRTTVKELKAFVSALVQADRLGVPIAQVLREQAREMRLKRRQLAEEKAQKVPVKILFPLMFCVLPSLFIIIMGPGAIQIMHVFSSM